MCHRWTIYLKDHTPFEGVALVVRGEGVVEVPMVSSALAKALAVSSFAAIRPARENYWTAEVTVR